MQKINSRTHTIGRITPDGFLHHHASYVIVTCPVHMISVGAANIVAETLIPSVKNGKEMKPVIRAEIDDAGIRKHAEEHGCSAFNLVRPKKGGNGFSFDLLGKGIVNNNGEIVIDWQVEFETKLIGDAIDAEGRFRGKGIERR